MNITDADLLEMQRVAERALPRHALFGDLNEAKAAGHAFRAYFTPQRVLAMVEWIKLLHPWRVELDEDDEG